MGVCHTDLFVASLSEGALGLSNCPKVLSHEGAVHLGANGSQVKIAKAKDPVLLSYDYCKECELCRGGEQSY